MADRDINGMQAQNWPVKDTSLTEKVRDNLKSLVSDPKLRNLYEALTNVIIASVKDSYGKSSDKKYIYQSDMLMARVRKAIDDKLSDLQVDSIKQLLTESTEWTNDTLTKLLLAAFKTLSVSIDKDTQNELVSKITVVVDKLLQDYTNRTESSKESLKDSSKSKKGKSELSKVLDALKSDSKSQKVKELDIKQYQTKTVSLISKTLNAVNFNYKLAVESITAGFKHTNQTISNEVSQLQENIEDVKSNSLGSSLPKWLQFLFKGLWNFILKPMFYVGKFLLKPIGYLVKGIWDNFIKKPIQELINITGTILGTVTSATTTALSTFFLTPKGAYMLGYIVGYVWGRWIKPYIYDPIMRILQPFQGWINGDKTFTEALKDSWKQFKFELQPIKDAISEWWSGKDGQGGAKATILGWLNDLGNFKICESSGIFGTLYSLLNNVGGIIGGNFGVLNATDSITVGGAANAIAAALALLLIGNLGPLGWIANTAIISAAIGEELYKKLFDNDTEENQTPEAIQDINDSLERTSNDRKEITQLYKDNYDPINDYLKQNFRKIKEDYNRLKAKLVYDDYILSSRNNAYTNPYGGLDILDAWRAMTGKYQEAEADKKYALDEINRLLAQYNLKESDLQQSDEEFIKFLSKREKQRNILLEKQNNIGKTSDINEQQQDANNDNTIPFAKSFELPEDLETLLAEVIGNDSNILTSPTPAILQAPQPPLHIATPKNLKQPDLSKFEPPNPFESQKLQISDELKKQQQLQLAQLAESTSKWLVERDIELDSLKSQEITDLLKTFYGKSDISNEDLIKLLFENRITTVEDIKQILTQIFIQHEDWLQDRLDKNGNYIFIHDRKNNQLIHKDSKPTIYVEELK